MESRENAYTPTHVHEMSLRDSKKQKLSPQRRSLSPSAFWDNLSKVWLTRNALRELDRRNNRREERELHRRSARKPLTRAALVKEENLRVHQPAAEFLYHCPPQRLKDIQRYARLGGPDLSELRGYQGPVEFLLPSMISRRSKYRIQKCGSRASRTSWAVSTSESTLWSTITAGPYDSAFQEHLIAYGIYPHAYRSPDGRIPPKPSNWNDIKERLARRRASLSPTKFTEEAHTKFVDANANANVTESIISVIEGDSGDSRCISGNVAFQNLAPPTDGTSVPGNPDRYYGARPEQLNREIRFKLDGQIVVSTQHDLPILPNFLLAAKGPDGLLTVASRQASYNGALGARAMHALQTYGQEQPEFDNNAYTITSIYYGGALKMFTSHISTKPTNSDRPEYHMTQLNAWDVTGNVEAFREGATWFRNARDWAKEQRDNAIRRANERFVSDVVQSTPNRSVSETSK